MYKIIPYGDRAIQIRMGDTISPYINDKLKSLAIYLSHYPIKGVGEWVQTYTTLTITYNPLQIRYDDLKQKLLEIENKIGTTDDIEKEVVEIPVCYDEEFGQDINIVAEFNELTVDDVIKTHSEPYYFVYMIGFSPGFPYLGGMSSSIATPRKADPRRSVPQGSVGIAGEQTGVYPLETPGGWQIIGRTPIFLYHPQRENPVLLETGKYIKFKPVSRSDFNKIKALESENKYEVKRYYINK